MSRASPLPAATAADPGPAPAAVAIDWQAVIDRLGCAVVLFDAQDRLLVCNDDFRQLYAPISDRLLPGTPFEDLLRLALASGLVPEAGADPEAWLRERLQRRREPGESMLRQMVDGRWRRITEARLPDGALLSFSVDVTELVQRTEGLQQAVRQADLANRRLQDAIEALPAGFELWDADDRLVASNARLARMYPQVAQWLQPGVAWEAIVRANHAAGALAVPASELDAYIEQRRRSRRTLHTPSEHGTGDGRWYRVFEHPSHDGGLVAVRVDITELRAERDAAQRARAASEAASRRLSDAIEALTEGFALFDADDRLVICNRRYREIYAVSAPAMTPGARFEDILRFGLAHGQYPQARGDEEAWLAARLQRHRHPGPPELQELPGNRWLRVDECRTREGGFAGVRTDVTELVRREQQLVELNAALDEARARLQELSDTDALTGIANRRHFDRRLDEEWLRARRHGTPLALLLIDVDHFKRFNDLHGHQAGDAALRAVAGALVDCARRPGELVARYGGEEFAVLLPHADSDLAMHCAEACLRAVDEARVRHGDSPTAPHLTISIGAAEISATAGAGVSSLLAAADRALYRAKAAGRHRVEIGH